MCAVAAVLFGTFSIAGALGAASSGRTTATQIETASTGACQRAQAAYDTATAELGRLEPARSVDELLPLVEAAKPQCRVRVDSTGQTKVCAKPSGLLAELGRAHRRSELQQQIDKASAVLSTGQTVRPANADSKALAKYLVAIGLDVSADRITDLLVVLAVLVLELGPGACLSLAMALPGPVAAAPSRPSVHNGQATEQPTDRPAATGQTILASPASDIEHALRSAGGSVDSLRALAERVGRPKSSVAAECHRLASAGAVRLAKRGRGTRIELVARPN